LADEAGSISHRELADTVADAAARFHVDRWGRRLVHVPLTSERRSVISYLSVLTAGHVALVTNPQTSTDIVRRYHPDAEVGASGELVMGPRRHHALHPDLALLLSTSGSTGSPKLVRLSAASVLSNADAIVTALRLQPNDRGITTLPLHYCFGLSVLHSHLRAGASVVLRTGSVTEPGFGAVLADQRVTTLAVTPYLLDLLRLQGVLDDRLPALRLIAQAGGALAPQRIAELAALGRRQGWGLAVMYGQTEATARMAVLPPELAERFPDAAGWPVTGSHFRVDTPVRAAPDTPGSPLTDDAHRSGASAASNSTAGELIFDGPGVMMGYAEHPDDLALPRMVTELRTGDIGTVDEHGLVRVLGRRSGFVKIMGVRVDLGRVERLLDEQGVRACVTGDDTGLRVCVVSSAEDAALDDIRPLIATAAGIGALSVRVRAVAELPLLPTGKVDRRACAEGFDPASPAVVADVPEDALAQVVRVIGPLLGSATLDPDRSFAELGGDSFSHVQASTRMARLLPGGVRALPRDWHHRPLRELAELIRDRPAGGARRTSWWTQVETTTWLRAAAAIMICGSHIKLFPLAGGAHILLAVAGFHYARYVLATGLAADRWRRTVRGVIGVAVPTVLVAVAMKLLAGAGDWPRVVLLHWLLDTDEGNIFWFVECLLAATIASTVLLSVPWLRVAVADDPWRVTMVGCLVALVPRYLMLGPSDGPGRGLPWTVAWLFVAGLAMATAATWQRRAITVAVAAAATIGFFPNPERNLVIMGGLVLLGTVASMPIPRLLTRPVAVLAAASLYIYLIQFQVFTYSDVPLIQFSTALAAGLVFWALAHPLVRRCQALVAPLGRRRFEKGPTREPTIIPDRRGPRRNRQFVGL
jgi:acyl-CoA synthetase (AMP-forming)/AMP-acid ligase II